MGLREDHRLRTERLLRRSALELARQRPLDEISVEDICQKADVSYRTFFNYFPYKEAAFLMPPPPFPDEAVAEFLSGNTPLLDRLTVLLAAQALASAEIELIDVARRIAVEHPKVAALQTSSYQEFETKLAMLIGRARGMANPTLDDQVLAGAMLGALRVVLDHVNITDRGAVSAAIRKHLGALPFTAL